MSKEELIKLVKAIRTFQNEKDGTILSEEEVDRMIDVFCENIANKRGTDLLFYPHLCGLTDDPTDEEIVDLAMKKVE